MSEEHVLDDIQVVTEGQILIHRRDTKVVGLSRRLDADLPALPEYLSGSCTPDTRHCLDQRRFAGPVVTDESGDLSLQIDTSFA